MHTFFHEIKYLLLTIYFSFRFIEYLVKLTLHHSLVLFILYLDFVLKMHGIKTKNKHTYIFLYNMC